MERIMADEFERLVPEFLSLARRIFDAGVQAERARLLALIQPDARQDAGARHEFRRESASYGTVSPLVKDALGTLAVDSPDGVGAGEIAAYFDGRGGGPTEKQVRAALKQLHNTGEAIRASRGRYLPRATATPPAREENPDAGASGDFDLAAE
jgi:hypothetical protein